ncbi:MAG TPA: hypothetical protein VGH72_33705 [Pseudonocardia sp.]|jgi:hypothetical protein
MIDEANRAEFDRLTEWLARRAVRGPLVQCVLWTGSRTWRKPLVREVFELFDPSVTHRHGGAKGWDTLVDQLCRWTNARTDVHPGRPGHYLERDRRMADLGADCCIAGIRQRSRGATYTAAYARQGGIDTFVFIDND